MSSMISSSVKSLASGEFPLRVVLQLVTLGGAHRALYSYAIFGEESLCALSLNKTSPHGEFNLRAL